MSNNVTKTDPPTGAEAVPVHNHGQNVENEAHPGNQASNASYPNNTTQGDKAINTSTSLTGAGGLGTGASGAAVDNSPSALKTPRKTDGSAHSAPGGTLHGGDSHKA